MNQGDRHGTINWESVAIGCLLIPTVIAPVFRIAWLHLTERSMVNWLSTAFPEFWLVPLVLLLWAVALVVGRQRGPALRPPFQLSTLLATPRTLPAILAAPLLRWGLGIVCAAVLIGGGIAATLVASAGLGWLGALEIVLGSAGFGLVTTVMWLLGQARVRRATWIALCLLACSGATGFAALTRTPTMKLEYLPWLSVLVLVAATVLSSLAPALLKRLHRPALLEQSLRWETAKVSAGTLDFGAASSAYRALPSPRNRGNVIRPVRPFLLMCVLRDAMSAARVPGRTALAILTLSASAALLIWSSSAAAELVSLRLWGGAIAGALILMSLRPLTAGLVHAGEQAGDPSRLYGLSDARLATAHLIFPVICLVVILGAAGSVSAAVLSHLGDLTHFGVHNGLGELTTGISAPAIWGGALVVVSAGLAVLTTAFSVSLRGAIPLRLLTPVPTPVGDISIIAQLCWGAEALLLASLTGIAVAFAPLTVAPFLLLATIVGASTVRRWLRRN